MIIAWSGSISNVPYGWKLCNGSNGTPDLRDRFILGAGGSYNIGNVGGEKEHILTIAELPRFNLTIPMATYDSVHFFDYGPNPVVEFGGSTPTSAIGGNQPHNIMPPYYSLAYIMRII